MRIHKVMKELKHGARIYMFIISSNYRQWMILFASIDEWIKLSMKQIFSFGQTQIPQNGHQKMIKMIRFI